MGFLHRNRIIDLHNTVREGIVRMHQELEPVAAAPLISVGGQECYYCRTYKCRITEMKPATKRRGAVCPKCGWRPADQGRL